MQSPIAPLLTTPAGRHQLFDCYRSGLLEDTVRFWFPRSVDAEHGGFCHCLDRDGTLVDTDKSMWVQGRMTWMLLSLYNTVEKRPEWLAWAEQGLKFIDRFGFDTDGRMFFHVTRDGKPIRKRRYAYSETCAAVAYAAHARATGNERSAQRARDLFDHFLRWSFTPGLMPPKYTDTRPMIGLGPRMVTIVTAQELQASLGSDPTLAGWIDRAVEEIEHWFIKPELQVVMETVGADGEVLDHFDGRTLNPGHAIETAGFILHEAQLRGDANLLGLGCQMLDFMWHRGWDQEYGGIFYFRDVYNKPVQEYWQDMKFWWPHNEAVVATLLAYELTGDRRYATWHQLVHDWSYQHFPDREFGEWYGYLHRDGRISTTLKGNMWKSCFHHPRMQWFASRQLEMGQSLSSSVMRSNPVTST